ncbi:PorP/SprF family type IX secretion system membrane protein [Sediminitomix flava]|nr:type IX secretion system membrane protein PorP/SprF [Sediminitomix flava]
MNLLQKALLTVFVVLAFTFKVNAQQQSLFSQYMNNMLTINPAYVGSQKALSLTAVAREQWIGLDGAPSTQTFSAHLPIERKNIGVGMMLTNDRIGVTKQNGVAFSYAYKIKMLGGELSMGIKGGFINYSIIYSDISETDPSFQEGNVSEVHPDIGLGLYFNTNKFYLGLSAPQITLSEKETNDIRPESALIPHYFIQGGYVFDINPDLKLKPSFMTKIVEGAPIEVDINANVYLRDLVGLGVSWRSMDAVVLLGQVQITNRLQFGYAYDITTTDVRQVSAGSHEIFLNYRIPISKSKIITPRYF